MDLNYLVQQVAQGQYIEVLDEMSEEIYLGLSDNYPYENFTIEKVEYIYSVEDKLFIIIKSL